MKRNVKIIVIFIIILLILGFYFYREKLNQQTILIREQKTNTDIVEVEIIDKYNKMSELYENPQKEEYVLVNIKIDGILYIDVGIRTKGNAIYEILDNYKLDNYSFKVKLDYKDKTQNYKGMTELHLNTTAYDATGIREYLTYSIYNQMGIETQQYYLGHLYIGDVDRGLITIVEVINENYVEYKYESANGNLYKPTPNSINDWAGADLRYYGENAEYYEGILNGIKTVNTTPIDQKRLINIIKNINESSETEIIEENFMDFDKIIKMIAINKVIINSDVFTSHTLRNYFIYEENGKIDIMTFDMDLSLNAGTYDPFWTDNVNEYDLSKSDLQIYSRITEIIIENEEYTEKYNQYVEEAKEFLNNGYVNNLIDELYYKTKDIINSNEKKIYSYEFYEEHIQALKLFVETRGDY